MPTAIAAGVAALLMGTWWVSPEGRVPAPEALRGGDDAMVLEIDVRDGQATIRFAPVPGAGQYRVRLFTADGRRLAEQTAPDTSLTLVLPSDPGSGRAAARLLIEVTAFDPLLEVVATSGLVSIEASAP
jgi:hypothetical protein